MQTNDLCQIASTFEGDGTQTGGEVNQLDLVHFTFLNARAYSCNEWMACKCRRRDVPFATEHTLASLSLWWMVCNHRYQSFWPRATKYISVVSVTTGLGGDLVRRS